MNAATFISSPPYTLAGEVMIFTKEVLKRFGDKVNFVYLDDGEPDYDQCWEWNACISGGYGRFRSKNLPALAHRLSYIMTYGDIPEDLQVLHKCDNPSCVNPTHLFLGDNSDNVKDKVSKNRQYQGSNVHFSKLNEDDVKNILIGIYEGTYTNSSQIESKFDISDSIVGQLILGKIWKSTIREVEIYLNTPIKDIHDMIKVSKPKLTEKLVRKIRLLLKQGHKPVSIAKQIGCSKHTIYNIIKGKTWSHIVI